MIFKPLASIAKIVAGQSPDSSTYNSTGEGFPFFQGKADFQDMYPTVRMWCTSDKRKEAEPGDILISVRAPVGAVNICNQKSIIGRGLAAIRTSADLDGKFLYYWLKANEQKIDALGTGSTFKAITQDTLKKIEVPVPPLNDQIRIAHLLGKVERLIAQRKHHLQQLDDLLKSVFLEMFGDPVRNEKGWEKRPCSKVAEIITGHPFKSDLYTDDKTQLKLCGGLIIYPQRIEWDKCNYWPEQLLPGLERYLLKTDDIVLAMDRPWISSGLKICIVDEAGSGSLLVQRTARLRAKEVEQYFLYAHLKDVSFTRHCKPTETTVPHISIKDIQTFQVLCPPRELQASFSSVAGKIDHIKLHYQQSLTDLQTLYGALSQQAFKGELDLSRVVLPAPAQRIASASIEDSSVVPEPTVQALPAIHLPETELLVPALQDRAQLAPLLHFWLEAYRTQLGGTAFSLERFIAAAQTRLTEQHPDNDFELHASEYDIIKAWVFDEIQNRKLKQTRDIICIGGKRKFGNEILLRARKPAQP